MRQHDSTLVRNILPYLHHATAGSGGRIREEPADFLVEEEPLYQPCGDGEHLYLRVEKENLSTNSAVRLLLRKLRLPSIAAGFAGRKDTSAIARQWLSFHTSETPDPESLSCEGLKILAMSRHGNKLRKGHLAGNHFSITIRGLDPDYDPAPVLESISKTGFPNYFGLQRMGIGGENPAHGKALLLGDGKIRTGGERARFAINAYQSALFNEQVATRLMEYGCLTTLEIGDLALLHRNRAVFPVTSENLEETRSRAHSGELSASALLPGYQAPLAEGRSGDIERNLLAREGITQDTFRRKAKRHSPKGERRAVRMVPENLSWEAFQANGEHNLRMSFFLPKGTYATSLLREMMRNDDLGSYLDSLEVDVANA